jgi:hypothetical protein
MYIPLSVYSGFNRKKIKFRKKTLTKKNYKKKKKFQYFYRILKKKDFRLLYFQGISHYL